MKEKIIAFLNTKEVKVFGYIVLSALIGEGIKIISGLQVNDVVITGLINVALVALVELKKRIDLNR